MEPNRCSWCIKEMNLKPESGSHGICARHKAMEMAEFLRWKYINAVEDAMALPRRDEDA